MVKPIYLKLSAGGLFVLILSFMVWVNTVRAATTTDVDTDGDGYPDQEEISHGYSPFNPLSVKLEASDVDHDGLSDYWELKFKTDPFKADTDGDGHRDFAEIDSLHNPLSSSTKKLSQRIEVDLKKQQLTYFVGGQPWKKMVVSTGKASMPTPRGNFPVVNKSPKAWSNSYKLWMPYWMGLSHGEFGLHELPIWPNGYQEGKDHLGRPVSHGCIRLGVKDAKYLYDRVTVGTIVTIK